MMLKRIFLALTLLTMLICLPLAASAATYYVSTTGSDSSPGTIDKPFKTLQKGANALRAGDTMYIREGRYYERVSFFLQNGTEEALITVMAYPGERVILDGNNYANPPPDSGSALITVWASWYVIKNIEVTASGEYGVVLAGKHNTLDGIFSYKNRGWGNVNSGDYSLVQNSRFWSNSMNNENYAALAKGEGWGGGVTCARYPAHCTIRNCTSWDNWGEGISTFETMYATIEDCTSYDNQQNFYISDTKHTVLQRSLSYCTPGNPIDQYVTQNGILVGDEKGVPIPLGPSGTRYSSSNNTFLNNLVIGCDRNLAASIRDGAGNLYAYNTFANCDGDSSEPASVLLYAGDGTTVRFINNIIIQDDNLRIIIDGSSGTAFFSNNLWSKTPSSSATGPNDIIGDAKLARQATLSPGLMTAEWFKLLAGSPAIGKAIILNEVNEDHFKNTRDSSPDIGAHEYPQAAGPVISSVKSPQVSENYAAITWTTDIATSSQVEYGTTTSYGSQTSVNTNMVTSHFTRLNNLVPATAYHYRVKSTGSSGASSTSLDYTLKTSTVGNITYFSSGFETGNLLEWINDPPVIGPEIGGSHTGGGYLTTEKKHTGTYSWKAYNDPNLPDPDSYSAKLLRWRFPPSAYKQAYYSAWFFWPADYTVRGVDGEYANIFQYKERIDPWDPTWIVAVKPSYQYASEDELVLHDYHGQQIYRNGVKLPKGRWFQIEAFLKSGRTDGKMTVWLDGQQIFDLNNINTAGNPSNTYNELMWGVGNYAGAGIGKHIYVDDITVTDYRIGASTQPVPGDLDGNGVVDSADFFIIVSDFGKSSGFNNPNSDTNSDGIVDIYDLVYVASRII